jgi:hypothetical protein
MNTNKFSFTQRVEHAARCIRGGSHGNDPCDIGSREYDNWFENGDGAVVVAALWREADTDPAFQRAVLALFSDRQLPDLWKEDIARHAQSPTDRLPIVANNLRRRVETFPHTHDLALFN